MKQKLQTVFVMSLVFLTTNAVGQTLITDVNQKRKVEKTAKTYLDLMVNVVRTNVNYGKENSSLEDYKKSNMGVQSGISFQSGITPSFSLVSELYFIRKGGKLKATHPLTTGESSLRLNTIELPVLARFHIGKVYLNAGPSIAYNLSGRSKIENISEKISFKNSTHGFKRFDAGVQIGGGLEFPVKQRRIALDLRYNYGLTNIAYSREIYNRAVMISVHFSKPWKKNPLGRNKSL